ERLEVTDYDSEPGCRSFSYRRGEFTDSPDFVCTAGRLGIQFDSGASLDLAQFQVALAATGLDVKVVSNSEPARGFPFGTSASGFEFDTSPPRWCLLCPSVNFFNAPSASRPVDDLIDHYVVVNADWYVNIHYEGVSILE
ncbi:MAG TPA: hypothetical protein VKR24_00675, partial [Candidatus Limnocylindrales bacterium]|nr:hypothetical protein [Candidatus Limnocylindrales bacterium]